MDNDLIKGIADGNKDNESLKLRPTWNKDEETLSKVESFKDDFETLFDDTNENELDAKTAGSINIIKKAKLEVLDTNEENEK